MLALSCAASSAACNAPSPDNLRLRDAGELKSKKWGGAMKAVLLAVQCVRLPARASNTAVGCRAPSSAATTSAGACEMRVSLFNKKRGRGHACT